jgi:hypothetical protein
LLEELRISYCYFSFLNRSTWNLTNYLERPKDKREWRGLHLSVDGLRANCGRSARVLARWRIECGKGSRRIRNSYTCGGCNIMECNMGTVSHNARANECLR